MGSRAARTPRGSQPSLPPRSLSPVHPDNTPAAPTKFCRKNSAAAIPLTAAPLSSRSARIVLRAMIHFVLLISRQGKVRLTKWYSPYNAKD